MTTQLSTNAERQAEEAENLPAFSGLKLLHIKRELESLLKLIGRAGFFDSYTIHDISHIDWMLESLDWLIPERTKKSMSPADWLMIVLAIYFHDLGMLVTEHEYQARSSSGFNQYCAEELFDGAEGEDYRLRVKEHYPDPSTRERFLYQEFVRHSHARRISAWITGRAALEFGIATDVIDAISGLLAPLDGKFRSDLATVCESHHLNDLSNLRRYPVSQPYGNTARETCNLQYAAVMLRTADLLHITCDRTPSIAFRVINPTDPISQQEWAKQSAVKSVRRQPPRDAEGAILENGDADTIEVFAYFTNANGFFGLTSYLKYAGEQVRQSYDWIEHARKQERAPHEFPWREIDGSHIEASGFLARPFAFELDQARILDLLTGHTLYNDTSVVLRELTQNAIDAVRLEASLRAAKGSTYEGSVSIRVSSRDRTIVIEDNGTGMTQEIIERNLLRVGASRYLDPEFIKQNPEFSSISRFGIGILSCFMVADDVEITTCHKDDIDARQLTLRTVHGKYLIRLLEKGSNLAPIYPSGTRVKLKLRPSADLGDVESQVRRWVVFPRCQVEVRVDDATPVAIGYDSPRAALASVMRSIGLRVVDEVDHDLGSGSESCMAIREHTEGAVTIAYAVRWSEVFREWQFVGMRNTYDDDDDTTIRSAISTCIEGIRVEFTTPGFEKIGLAAIANATGRAAPKTNVARSSFESTPELAAMLRSIYRCYTRHIRNEFSALHERRSFSLTWATGEVLFMVKQFLESNRASDAVAWPILKGEIEKLPTVLVEHRGERRALSPVEIASEPSFWTSESALLKSAERLIKEVPGSASLSALFASFGAPGLGLPDGMILSADPSDVLPITVFERREVERIEVIRRERRVDLLWRHTHNPAAWRGIPPQLLRAARRTLEAPAARRFFREFHIEDVGNMRIGASPILLSGLAGEAAILSRNFLFVVHGTEICSYLNNWIDRLQSATRKLDAICAVIEFSIAYSLFKGSLEPPVNEVDLRKLISDAYPSAVTRSDVRALVDLINRNSWQCFDPSAWDRPED